MPSKERIIMETSKAEHPSGIWDNEPDKFEWEHKGFACVIVRHSSTGSLCGYVGIPKEHIWHGKGYNDQVPWDNLETHKLDIDKMGVVACFCAGINSDIENGLLSIGLILKAHGGITYAKANDEYPSKNNGLWWFGFDCGHAGDLSPYVDYVLRDSIYRDFEYVKKDVNCLAEQLALIPEIAPESPITERDRLKAVNAELLDALGSALVSLDVFISKSTSGIISSGQSLHTSILKNGRRAVRNATK